MRRKAATFATLIGGLVLAVGVPLTPTQAEAAPSVASENVAVELNRSRPTLAASELNVGDQTRAAPTQAGKQLLAGVERGRTRTFSTVGVTWRADPTQPAPVVQVQTKQRSGWSDWVTISQSEPLSGANGLLATPARYVGPSTGVKVRLLGDGSTQPTSVQLVLLNSATNAADARLASSNDQAPQRQTMSSTANSDLAAKPVVISRAGWGANESWKNCSPPDIDPTIQGITIHHTAGSNNYTAAEAPGIVRSVYSYHARTLGWCDIGYNFLVDKFGKIYEGRAGGQDIPVRGSHARAWNYTTSGVSFMGNYETALPPQVMLESGARIAAWKLDGFQRRAKGSVTIRDKQVNIIFRHGDVVATSCPGKHLNAKMWWIRDRAAALIGARSPVYPAWQARGGESGATLGSPSIVEKSIDGGRYAAFVNGDLTVHPQAGTRVVKGAIRNRYRALGTTTGRLGWPISDEEAGPFNSRVSRFQNGDIYWSNDTKAREVAGQFYVNYPAVSKNIGLPTSYEYRSPYNSNVVRQDYQMGRQYWSQATGGFAVYGANLRLYKQRGEESSPLGVPRSNEYGMLGGRVNDFTTGGIYHIGPQGSRSVQGAIYRRYRQLNGPAGRLGWPLTEERDAPGGRISEFQFGTIHWTRNTGEFRETYK